jgi:hypothetical protein
MFENTFRLIRETKNSLMATEEGVEEAKEAYSVLQRDITNARARYRRKVGNDRGQVVARDIIKTLKAGNLLESIGVEEIDSAVVGSEFESDVYLSKLYQVANSKDIYNLILVGTGWNSHLATLVSFEEEAGRLSDYARGIRAYRASLGSKEGEAGSARGIKATNWWFENVFQNTLEETTVEGRVGVSGRPAPFWKLLDSGSQPLPSDRTDGTYNPVVQSPTGFIAKIEIRINKEFETLFKSYKAEEFEEAELLKNEIDTAVSVREGLNEDIRMLTTDLNRSKSVLNSLGAKADYASQEKLARIIRRMDEGERLPSRVNIGKSGRNLTISVKKLEGLIYD